MTILSAEDFVADLVAPSGALVMKRIANCQAPLQRNQSVKCRRMCGSASLLRLLKTRRLQRLEEKADAVESGRS